jgi:hypothetical protein
LQWSREEHASFPAEFRAVVRQLVRGQHSSRSVLSTLPMDSLELVIARLARDPYCFPVPVVAQPKSRPVAEAHCDAILQ